MKTYAFLFAFLVASVLAAFAQEDEESNGFIIDLIQDSLSTDSRQIRIRGIEGLLASQARVQEITVSDREGVWLTIRDADIDWTRRALLSKRLKIDSMSARSLEITRLPLPDPSLPTLEAEPFSLPELPLSIEIGALDIPTISLGEPILGQAAELDITGSLTLIDGRFQAALDLNRKDRAGAFSLFSSFENTSRDLKVDLAFDEPGDGIVANLLKIEGRPALKASVIGAGPLDNIDLKLEVETDGVPSLFGDLRLRDGEDGLGFDVDLLGELSPLIAPAYATFFEGQSQIRAVGQTRASGGFDIDRLKIETASLNIDGAASTTDDGFLRQATLKGSVGDGQTQTVLPFGQDISIKNVALDANFGVDPTGLWALNLTGDTLIAGDISAEEFNLLFQGTADGIETPQARRLTVNAIGDLSGLNASTPDLTRALGQRLTFQLASDWTPGRFQIERARIGGAAARLELAGLIEDFGFSGDISAHIERLAPFGGALGRDLQGAVDLSMSGQINPLLGSFDLEVDGTSEALKLDIAALDTLLIGTTDLSGRVLRNETGFRTQNLALTNRQVTLRSDGVLATDRADLTFQATLRDLSILTKQATGPVSLNGTANGTDGQINLQSSITIPQGTLLDKPLQALNAQFEGLLSSGNLDGQLAGNGQLDEEPLSIFAQITTSAQNQSIQDLMFTAGPSQLTGNFDRANTGLIRGTLDLTSPDVSLLAALFLQEATGRANATLNLSPDALGQRIEAAGDLSDISFGAIELGRADLDVLVQNAFGVPTIAGDLIFKNAQAAGVEISSGTLSAGGRDGQTGFNAALSLSNETDVAAVGALTATDAGFDLELSKLDVDKGDAALVSLEQKATVQIAGERIDLDELSFAVGDGQLRASGLINGGIDLAIDLQDLPLALVNAFREDLGLKGALSGQARITGARDAPDVSFDLAALGLGAAALEAASLPEFDLTATGETDGGKVNLEASLTGPNSLDSTITGTVTLSDQEMELAGQLNAFPLALIDRLAGGQGLLGNVTGGFNLLGTPAKPRVNFEVDGTGISLSAMRQNAIAPLAFSATGSFVNNVITLPEARVTGADAMNFTLSGRIPLKLDGLDAAAVGTVPLSVMNVALARSGLSATGTVNLALRAKGALSAPDLSGSATLNSGTFVSAQANTRLEDVNIQATFAGDKLNLTRATARNSRGGTIQATGAITVDPAAGFPIALTTTVDDLRYTDGRLATALASGALAMNGALLRRSEVSGTIDIEELEFSLPQQLGTKKSYSLDVSHVNMTPSVRQTLSRADISAIPELEVKSDSDIAFDVSVNALNKVFVRGRGVDAELGGSFKLGGTTSNLKPVGQFDLIRGRINILSQRIELNEGFIRLDGTLDPEIYLLARTITDDVEATVTLEGPASKPVLAFSSVPELPQDEVLARLVFDRSLSGLSALQVAQLAAAAGELSGRTGPSFFSQLRDATGLDDLDFETDNEGTTTVRVGKYIQDNIYSSIEADNQGRSAATINLDINENFTARGSLDNQGDTSFGIFFEKDY